jgi:hypothetical protein
MLKNLLIISLTGMAIFTLSRLADSQFPQAPCATDGASATHANAAARGHSLLKTFLPLP